MAVTSVAVAHMDLEELQGARRAMLALYRPQEAAAQKPLARWHPRSGPIVEANHTQTIRLATGTLPGQAAASERKRRQRRLNHRLHRLDSRNPTTHFVRTHNPLSPSSLRNLFYHPMG